jgi:hypothetical protein
MHHPSRRAGLASFIAAFAVLAAPWLWPSSASAADRVMLISWDGVREEIIRGLMEWQPARDVPSPCPSKRHAAVTPTVDRSGSYLTCLPNMSSFQWIESTVLEGKPLTRPQHAQMLTGYGPLQTGVIANAGKKAVPPGLTIYERLKAARPEVKTVHIGGRKYTGKGITKWAIKSGALDVNLRRGSRDRYTGLGTVERVRQALDVVGNSPFFMFVHFKAVDVLGHRASHRSVPYSEAIIQNDLRLSDIKRLLSARGILDSTEIIVTTDHGFEGIFHVNADDPYITNPWIGSMNPILKDTLASVQDITPTILQLMGVRIDNVDPPYPGQSLLAGPLP